MKAPLRPLLVCFAWMVPFFAHGQIIQSSSFFDPDFRARRPGATSGLLNLSANLNPYDVTQSSGNTSWTHSATGFVQTRTNVTAPITGTLIANLDAQLAAYTETVGDTLVFGREITTSASLLGIPVLGQDTALSGLVSGLAGASVLYSWNANSTVSGLAIAPNQLYQVSFNVNSASGLPVNLLSSSTFNITTSGVTGDFTNNAQLLNLLNVVSVGSAASNGVYSLTFQSNQALDHLDFNFAATSGVGVSALGGTAANQNVLTFSGFNVVAVPEASSASLVMLCGVIGLMRRRRC